MDVMERMSSADVAVTIVRTWTRLYTWRMARDVREIRLGEIESDLWVLRYDTESRGVSPALHIVARLIMGVPSDVRWRVEQIALEPVLGPRAVMTAVALIAAALWMLPAW